MPARTPISVEEFDRLEEPDDLRYELDQGEVIATTRPRPLHNRVVSEIHLAVGIYLKQNPIGEVFNSDNLFVLAPDVKRAPDVAFIKAERARQIDPTEEIQGAPDLAIEVLSPNDSHSALKRKIRQYFAAGCLRAWVFDPVAREVEIWTEAGKPSIILHENELLEEPDLLPGFSIRVSDLFPE